MPMKSPPLRIREDIENGFRWPLGAKLIYSETTVEDKGGAGNYDVWTDLLFEEKDGTTIIVRFREAQWCGDTKYGIEFTYKKEKEESPQAPSPQQNPRGIGGVMDKEKQYSLEEMKTVTDILSMKQEMLRRAIETGTNAMAQCEKAQIGYAPETFSVVVDATGMLKESLKKLDEITTL